jgi:hypothetical protein
MSIPQEDQDFLQAYVQVFKEGAKAGRWMRRDTLRKKVVAGQADDLWAVDVDPETGDHSIICPYCATGVEHRGSFH